MVIEEKIILEVNRQLQDIKGEEENKIFQQVNGLFVYQSVKLTEKEQELKGSINFIENKLFDIIK